MGPRIDALIQKLDESRAFLDEVLKQVTDWEMQVYSDGLAWTARELAVHLTDADKGHNYQAMSIADGKDVIPEDFDIERYNQGMTKKNADTSAAKALDDLTQSRQQLKAWLSSIDDVVLDKKGRHASLRILTVEQILEWSAWHERSHAEDLQGVIAQT
mgnify:CR=1 FL=1